MESKLERKICGTCIYWNGRREILTDKNKIAILDESATCQCPIGSKSGETRKKDLKCKFYENIDNL